MNRLYSIIVLVFTVFGALLTILNLDTLGVINRALEEDLISRLILAVFVFGLGTFLVIAISAYFLLDQMRNVKSSIEGLRKDFLQGELSVFGQIFDSENELYDPEDDYEGNVYRKLIHLTQTANKSIKILTVPGVGDAETANRCRPMNCPARKEYFDVLAAHIRTKLRNGKEFQYHRIHQVPIGKDVSNIELTSRIHCDRLFELAHDFGSRFRFNPRYIANQRSTGFIIIDDSVLVLLTSGFTEDEHKPEDQDTPPQFVPYIMGIQIFNLRKEEKPTKLVDLVQLHVRAFDQVLRQSKSIKPDNPHLPRNDA